VAAIVGEEPAWDAALRLLGGLHFLVLAGRASWDDSLSAHADFLREFVRTQGVQTNEVQRSWVLLPLFLHATRGWDEIDVVELGPSAGLNLVWDHYRYEYREATWGESALTLTGEQRSELPRGLFARAPVVRRRVGIDVAPIDVTTDEGSRLLQCFVWGDQTERLERLRSAIDVVRANPPELVRGDIGEELPRVLDDSFPTLVFQTAVFGYVPDETVARVRETLSQPRPLAFVSAGGGRTGENVWGMRIFRPGREREYAGEADYHGAWLRYAL
jgi:hypothetical protein